MKLKINEVAQIVKTTKDVFDATKVLYTFRGMDEVHMLQIFFLPDHQAGRVNKCISLDVLADLAQHLGIPLHRMYLDMAAYTAEALEQRTKHEKQIFILITWKEEEEDALNLD